MEREYGPEGQIIIRGVPESQSDSYGAPARPSLTDLLRFYWPAIFMLLAVLGTGAGVVVAWTSSSGESSELSEGELAELAARATSSEGRYDGADGSGIPAEPVVEFRSIDVHSEPPGAEVHINMEPVGTTPLSGYRLPDGVHVLSVSTADGARVDTVILLDETAERSFFLSPQPYRDEVSALDQGSYESVPGEVDSAEPVQRDETITQQRSEASSRQADRNPTPVDAQPDARAASDQGPPGGESALDRSATGGLVVTSSPSGALVEIDGVPRGTTPLHAGGIEPGEHELRVSLDGHTEAHEVLAVGRAETVLRTYELRALEGTIAVRVRPWGSIYVDGELRARDLDVRHEMRLSIGPHRLAAVHPVLGRQELDIQVQAGQTREITIDLSSAPPGDR